MHESTLGRRYKPVYYGSDNLETSVMALLRNFIGIIGITGHDVGYQTVNSVGNAVGSHDGIVAGCWRLR
jgi:hypothetical protein